jgi:tyrosinase
MKKLEKRVKEGADIRFEIKKRLPIAGGTRLSLEKPFSATARVAADDLAALMETDQRDERVFVHIDYAELPAVNDFFVRVFVNLPAANAQTPTDDMHYAGSFAFFGTHDGSPGKTDFLVHVTDTLQKLRGQGALRGGEPLEVQLVAVPATDAFIRPETELILEGIELLVTPVIIRSR